MDNDGIELAKATHALNTLKEQYDRLMSQSVYVSEACKSLYDFAMLTPGCYSIPQGIHKQSSMHIEDKEKITEDKQKKNTRPLTKLASIFRSKSTEDLASPDNLRQGSCDSVRFQDSDSDSEYSLNSSTFSSLVPSKSCPDNLSSLLENTEPKLISKEQMTTTLAKCYIQEVPEEIMYEIFYYLDFRSLVACSLVCRVWGIILQSQPLSKNPLKRWDWVNTIYFNKNYLNRYYGDPLVKGQFYGVNIWCQKPKNGSNGLVDVMFRRNATLEYRQNKIIERELENNKHMQDLTICVPLLGDSQGRQLFKSNLIAHSGDCEFSCYTALSEYRCWFNSKSKTPIKVVEFSKHNGTSRSRKKFHHMFSDSVAVVVSYDLGQYDAPYVDSSGNIKGLLYHKLYRSLKDLMRLKSFSNASIILFLFKGDFERKVNAALESGDLSRDISLLFPEYQAHQSPEDQLEYFVQKLIGWCSSRKRNRSVSKYLANKDSDPQLVGILHDTVRHSVIQKRAYKLGLGTI